jgi:hypothetical protein
MDSHQEAGAGGAEGKGAPTHIVEVVVALLVMALGLTVLIGSHKLGSGWTTDGPGAGYFPFYIGCILCISAAGIIYQALVGKRRDTSVFVNNEQVKQVLTVLVPAIIYVGVVQVLGLYIASAIYIACFMAILGKYSWIKSAIVGVLIAVFFFFMFEVWFKVPLFKGALNPTSFLGY